MLLIISCSLAGTLTIGIRQTDCFVQLWG